MKAKKPHWEIDRVKELAASGKMIMTESKALASFPTFDAAAAAANAVIAGLHQGIFAETLIQTTKCDVYGVKLNGKGWYLKVTIDHDPEEELIIVSLHPLARPLKTNTGMVMP